MTSSDSDQNKKNPSSQDRIEEIKKEEQEDPTAYYSQGDAKDGFNEEAELSKPVASVEKAREEMSLLRAVAYLGFGLAALAIVFILFFIRDLDDRVGGVDSAVSTLEQKIAPLRKEVKDSLDKVNTDITVIKSKMNDSERRLAVMELKRALVAVQGMASSDSPDVNVKTSQVIASIQALLGEFGAGGQQSSAPVAPIPVGDIKVQEAPPIELPVVESEPQEHAPAVEEAASEPEATPEIEEITEEAPSGESSDDGEEEEGGEDEEEEGEDE